MNLTANTPPAQTAEYLRTLPAIRERCTRVFDLAKEGKLQYFDYHPEKEDDVTSFCVDIIKRDFGTDFAKIPPHGRWRHLDANRGRIEPLVAKWSCFPDPPSTTEAAKRLIDLFMVAVLLDAGAGSQWAYTEKESGLRFSRSEGLGVAAVHMFEHGLFSSDPAQPYRVDAEGLARVTVDKVAAEMQVTPENPLAQSQLAGEQRRVPVAALWHALITGLQPIWPPARTTLAGVSLGDVWPCAALAAVSPSPTSEEGADLVPFHKLTGWLAYSLMEPLQHFLHWTFDGIEDMTGLPEYRNGGLFLDLGVLSLKPGVLPVDPAAGVPRLEPSHPAIIEWRALTVILLDRAAAALRVALPAPDLTLAQVLESATWKGGREIAKTRRGAAGGPPIEIISDGTLF
ncbi:hypothetical protein FB451DRAFT_1338457 [Mycena latifolia]|nr:hypothetical protein FB451DRAFT_1338457 [Mycena latifolia]